MTSLQGIFDRNAQRAKSDGVEAQRTADYNADQAAANSPSENAILMPGASDLLNLCHSGHAGFGLLRDYIHSQGDRHVHFSCDGLELVGHLPVPRYIIVTEYALYRVPHSLLETGVFFNCRIPLDALSQIVAITGRSTTTSSGIDFQAEIYLRSTAAPNVASTSASVMTQNSDMFVLCFGLDATIRKSLLMALCSLRPQLTVLQKKSTEHVAGGGDQAAMMMSGEPEQQQKRRKSDDQQGIVSPQPRANLSDSTHASTGASNSRSRKAEQTTSTAGSAKTQKDPTPRVERKLIASQSRSRSPTAATTTKSTNEQQPVVPPIQDLAIATSQARSAEKKAGGEEEDVMSDEAFLKVRKLIHDSLLDCSILNTEDFAPQITPREVPEADPSRQAEREEVIQMLKIREAKMQRNIEFRLKYPHKVPTRVMPGIEYDKAHEDRMVLPDNYNDADLLGPSLYPLWKTWKSTGGLQGNDGLPTEWTLFDSMDLISSLQGREEVLFGLVGNNSMRRLQQMRELVERERRMFVNKHNVYRHGGEGKEIDDAESSSPNSARGGNTGTPSAQGAYRRSASGGYSTPPTGQHTGSHYNTSVRDSASVTGVPGLKSPETGSPKLTRTKPFNLSKSPSGLKRLRVMDTQKILHEMKQNFDMHLRTMHELRREQMEKELALEAGLKK